VELKMKVSSLQITFPSINP